MADACRRIPKAGDTAVRQPVRGDYTRFHWSLSVVVKRGPRAAIGATRDEFWFTKTNVAAAAAADWLNVKLANDDEKTRSAAAAAAVY